MRERVAPLGDKNIVGATVTRLRLEQGITQKALMAKMQTFGADISYSSLSKLEGQTRSVSDKEVYALARSLEVEISALFSVKQKPSHEIWGGFYNLFSGLKTCPG